MARVAREDLPRGIDVGGLPTFERGALVGIVTTADLLYAIVGPHGEAEEGRGAAAPPPAPAERVPTGTRG